MPETSPGGRRPTTHEPMSPGELERAFEALHDRLLDRAAAGDVTGASVEEAMVTVEELHVALRELQERNLELQRTQQSVVDERRRYEELFEQAPDAYIVTDDAGVVRTANQRARRLLGVGARFAVAKPLVVFVANDDRQSFRDLLELVAAGGSVEGGRFTITPREGEPVDVVATIEVRSGRLGREIRWALRPVPRFDVTGNPTVGSVLLSAADDLRGPLGVVLAAGETLTRHGDELTVRQLRAIGERIATVARDTSLFLDDLHVLAASLLEPRGVPEPTDIAAVVAVAVELEELAEHRVEVLVEPADAVATVTPETLSRVVRQLVRNVGLHTPPGTTVVVRAELRAEHLLVSVADDGPGTGDVPLSMLFEPTHRAPDGGRSGLGLTLVRQLAEAHGGRAWAEEVPTGGLRVLVTLSLAD